MRGYVPVDPQTSVSSYQYAVVFVPKRSRGRFPFNSVTIKESAELAVEHSDTEKKLYAAQVIGPSKSSEGQSIFYLSKWLEDNDL